MLNQKLGSAGSVHILLASQCYILEGEPFLASERHWAAFIGMNRALSQYCVQIQYDLLHHFCGVTAHRSIEECIYAQDRGVILWLFCGTLWFYSVVINRKVTPPPTVLACILQHFQWFLRIRVHRCRFHNIGVWLESWPQLCNLSHFAYELWAVIPKADVSSRIFSLE